MVAINVFLKYAITSLVIIIPMAIAIVAITHKGGGVWSLMLPVIVFMLLVMMFSIVSPLVEIAENTRAIKSDAENIHSQMYSIAQNSMKLNEHYSDSNLFRVSLAGGAVVPEEAINKLSRLVSSYEDMSLKKSEHLDIPPLGDTPEAEDKNLGQQHFGLSW